MAASPAQQLFITEVQEGEGNIALQATAGSGKTTTATGALKYVPRLKKSIFLSFSNAIVNELKERIPANVKCSTLHSLGCRMIMAKYKGVQIDKEKYFKLALDQFPKKDKDTFKKAFAIQDVCNYARLTLTPFNEEELKMLCEQYCLDAGQEEILISEILLTENSSLKKLKKIDFSDMIYFPATNPELVNETFDFVFVDEVQDTNNAQAELIANIIRKPKGRLIICGDEKQAIYGFQGSNVDSFQRIESRFNAKRMALTVSYRCSKAVVKLAKTIYPDVIDAHEDAPEGSVYRGYLDEAKEGDMVICRNTKPLISAFFYFLRKGIKSYIVGKDYEKGLIKLAESVQGENKEDVQENIEQVLINFSEELRQDGVKYPANNPKYIALDEKCAILQVILYQCTKASELVATIKDIFHEDKRAIKLLTAHRSKGLESERVFFIEHYNREKLLPSKYAVLQWQQVQEMNLLFVTYTRAKRDFIFVDFED